MKTYTIHRGTVRSAFTLYHHVMPIYARHERANDALGKATAAVIESESEERRIKSISGWDAEKVLMLAHAERLTAERGTILRSAQVELKNATARADEASKMHLVPFVPPYVPAKASRVYPAMKTCTSPRRALRMKGRVALADNGYYPYPGGYAGGAVQWGTFTAASGRNEWSERSQERALRAKNMALFGSDITVR